MPTSSHHSIVLVGGGTLGPVTPLLALAKELRHDDRELIFIGTASGPERDVVTAHGLEFVSISSPKLRRYLTWRHILMPFELMHGLWQSWRILRSRRPLAIVSAGGYVAVPVSLIGRLLHIPICLHQQDLQPSLTNRLLQPLAQLITVGFQDSLQQFSSTSQRQVAWIGNPVRDLRSTTHSFTLDPKYPTVFIFGGGTGAAGINQLVSSRLLAHMNVIHMTGGRHDKMESIVHPRYHPVDFLGETMCEALQRADVIVCRAGIGTISELAALGKAAIVIPMPNSHQELNAAFLQQHQAAIVRQQSTLQAGSFARLITDLLADLPQRTALSQAMYRLYKPGAAGQWAGLIEELIR